MRLIAFFHLLTLLPFYASGQTTGELLSINGTELFVTVKGNGEPLVVLHGGPGLNQSYFQPYLDALEKNFKVIYYDQRASGKSATPPPDSISMSFFIKDLEGIRKAFSIKRLNILAHSWGAVVAAHYALNYPRQIKKMILSNPAMLSREYDEEAARLSQKKTTHEDSVKRAELMGAGPMDINKYEAFFIMSFQSSAYDRKNLNALNLNLPENFPDANKALFTGLTKDPAQNMNLYDDLRSLKAPTLIIHGQADIIPLRSIDRLKGSLPNSQLLIFSESGHFPFVEETERFNYVVQTFLNAK